MGFIKENKFRSFKTLSLIILSTSFTFLINIFISLQILSPFSLNLIQILVTILIYLIAFVNISITLKFMTYYFSNLLNKMELDLYDKINIGKLSNIENIERGKILTYLNNDIRNIWSFLTRSIQLSIRVIYLLGSLLIIAYFNVFVALIVGVIVFLQLLVIIPLNRYIGKKSLEAFVFEEKYSKFFEDGVNNRPLLVGNSSLKKYYLDRIYFWKNKEFSWMANPIFGLHTISNIAEGISIFFRIALYVIVLYSFTLNSKYSPTIVFLVFLILIFIIGISDDLRIYMYVYFLAKESLNRLDNFFNSIATENNEEFSENIASVWHTDFSLFFKSLSFSYNNRTDSTIFNNVNFKFASKYVYILEGVSGVGKSTVVDLICRFYLPIEGEIFISNKEVDISLNINQVNLDIWRENISWAPQDPLIVSGTLEENLAIGGNYSHLDLIHTVDSYDLNRLKEIIHENRLNTTLDISDLNLIEEIAIFRTINSGAKISLFDEPLSTHNSNKQLILIKNLCEIASSENKLIFVISHNEFVQKFTLPNLIHIKLEDNNLKLLN